MRKVRSTAERLSASATMLLVEVQLWEIIKEISEKRGLKPEDLLGERRFDRICVARQEFFYRALDETAVSSVRIATALGGRTHACVAYGAAAYANKFKLKAPRGANWTGRRAVRAA